MPSRFSSAGTRADAERLARALAVDFREIPIEPIVEAFAAEARAVVRGPGAGPRPKENLQARVRGTLLMGALRTSSAWLVIATARNRVRALGRLLDALLATSPAASRSLKDVYKTDVFRLSSRLNENAGRELIPQSIIDRPPSAELRADQLDEDSLPPYPKLDRVLEAYVELDRSRDELAEDGFDPEVVDRAISMIDRAEYKRRQAPPGVKLRPKSLRPRPARTPITNPLDGLGGGVESRPRRRPKPTPGEAARLPAGLVGAAWTAPTSPRLSG